MFAKKFFSTLLTGVLLLALMPLQTANAIGFKISPIRFDLELEPGEKIRKIVEITNNGPTALSEFLVRDFLGKDDSGSPSFVENLDGDVDKFSLSSWISFPKEVRFERNETKDIVFEIDVPLDAEPGGHYGSIFVQQKTGQANNSSGAGTVSRVGALIFVKVAGDIEEDGELTNFEVDEQNITDEQVTFNVTINNTGNVHLKPAGKLFIKDESGNILEDIGFEPILNSFGAVKGTRSVDYVKINQQKRSLVLPGQSRSVEAVWEKGELLGDFSAYIELELGDEKPKIITSDEIQFSIRKELSGSIDIAKNMYLGEEIPVNVQVKNTGTAKLVEPKVSLKFYNMFGAEIENIRLDVGKNEIITNKDGKKENVKKLSKDEEEILDIVYENKGIFGPLSAKLIYTDEDIVLDEIDLYGGTMISLIIAIVTLLVVLLIIIIMVRGYLKLKKQAQRIAENKDGNE